MDDASEVEVLDAAEHLVEEVGHPLVVQVHVDHLVFTFGQCKGGSGQSIVAAVCHQRRQVKRYAQDLAEICIHKFHHNVEIEEFLKRLLGREAVEQADDVLVVD